MTMDWKPVSERPAFGDQPMRQFVLVAGARHHSDVIWPRKHWGVAYIRAPGADDETQQYRKSDIEQILKDGDMDYGGVTHWMPAILPRFPATEQESAAALNDRAEIRGDPTPYRHKLVDLSSARCPKCSEPEMQYGSCAYCGYQAGPDEREDA